MKKILFSLLFLMFTGIYLAAQAPAKFRYQAVARDASGVVYTNTSLEMRFSFLEGGQFGTVRYAERHIVSVNPTGAFDLTLGDGSVVIGNFADINWSNHQYWLKVELNPNPGSGSFTNMGTSQLLTVPYAMFARQAGNANFTAGQGISISPDQIITNTGDLSITNELQQLSISNNVLTLSNSGGSVTLPSVTFTAGNGISISGNVISNTGDADASPTNEIQVLGLSGNTLSLSNGGGSVTLPLGTDSQTLSVTGNQLSISNGNAVTIPGDTNPGDDITIGYAASGDLSGHYPNPSVDGLQGRPVSSGVPSVNHVLQWNGSQWIPGSNVDTNPNDDVHGSGTTNHVSKFTNPTTLGNSQIYDNGANVGIGTTTTTSKLNVAGDVRLINGKLVIDQSSEYFSIDVRTDGMVAFEANGTTGNNSLVIDDDGDQSVMIGTNIPQTGFKLKVVGKAKFNDGVFFGSVEGFTDGGGSTIASNSTLRPTTDNVFDLGTSTYRWDEVWATDGSINTSDARFKKNIQPMSYGMKEVMKLRPVRFEWDKAGYENKPRLGLIAQEVQTVIGEVVRSENLITDIASGKSEWQAVDKLGIAYAEIIPVLIAGMQEQQRSIETLQDQLAQLRAELKALKEAQIKK